jgi:hypothetical protein
VGRDHLVDLGVGDGNIKIDLKGILNEDVV